ncbi:ATP-dependent nuclease [Candidatus Poriferisocius sp.]|uniref:ATP-dependent nuclease n=1 Tax=Candidatus Poriferisocius sp. TaxID=3101276 RepID=UPI003B0247D4
MPHFLSEVYLDGLRGINDLRIEFEYPVSVIAGSNATGKSTILFAAACAYKVPDAKPKDFVPSTFFPDYRPKSGSLRDARDEVAIVFQYKTPEGHRSMQWGRKNSWGRSYMGRRGATQPERNVYLRTLSDLRDPSGVSGVLSLSRLTSPPQQTALTASQINFAQQLLPMQYNQVFNLSSGEKSLLFATLQGGTEYSELHMSSGERSILRLSQEIAQLEGALVLIDEVEAGLHPELQQLLMLQIQQLALRNSLQVIVTSHSPVILDSVPSSGRIFLSRNDDGDVIVQPPYKDIIQDALYGRSVEQLNILCEDDIAESILYGILDYMITRGQVRLDAIRIGRDTGADEFPTHARALGKFGPVKNFVFILDGDKEDSNIADKIIDYTKNEQGVLYLPGKTFPESWVWNRLSEFDSIFGITRAMLADKIRGLDALYDPASDSPSEKVKFKLRGLADELNRKDVEICREVAKLEAGRVGSDIQPLVEKLTDILIDWRSP